jgi:hypothetical protein
MAKGKHRRPPQASQATRLPPDTTVRIGEPRPVKRLFSGGMRAWEWMIIAFGLYVIARWGTGKTVSWRVIPGAAFAAFVIFLLDHGNTAVIAHGLALLFVVGAAYPAIPVLTNAVNWAVSGKTAGTAPATAA